MTCSPAYSSHEAEHELNSVSIVRTESELGYSLSYSSLPDTPTSGSHDPDFPQSSSAPELPQRDQGESVKRDEQVDEVKELTESESKSEVKNDVIKPEDDVVKPDDDITKLANKDEVSNTAEESTHDGEKSHTVPMSEAITSITMSTSDEPHAGLPPEINKVNAVEQLKVSSSGEEHNEEGKSHEVSQQDNSPSETQHYNSSSMEEKEKEGDVIDGGLGQSNDSSSSPKPEIREPPPPSDSPPAAAGEDPASQVLVSPSSTYSPPVLPDTEHLNTTDSSTAEAAAVVGKDTPLPVPESSLSESPPKAEELTSLDTSLAAEGVDSDSQALEPPWSPKTASLARDVKDLLKEVQAPLVAEQMVKVPSISRNSRYYRHSVKSSTPKSSRRGLEEEKRNNEEDKVIIPTS